MLRIARASALHEWERLREDPWDLAMISLVPMLTVLLLWWIFSAGLPGKLPIGLLDQDRSALSRQAARLLQASPGLDITRALASEREAEQALRSGQCGGHGLRHIGAVAHAGFHITLGLQALHGPQHGVARHAQAGRMFARGRQAGARAQAALLDGAAQLRIHLLAQGGGGSIGSGAGHELALSMG